MGDDLTLRVPTAEHSANFLLGVSISCAPESKMRAFDQSCNHNENAAA